MSKIVAGAVVAAGECGEDDITSANLSPPSTAVDEPLPAVAAVVSFIDAINRGDVTRLGDLMTEDHHLDVFDEPPLRGRDANLDAWRGYSSA